MALEACTHKGQLRTQARLMYVDIKSYAIIKIFGRNKNEIEAKGSGIAPLECMSS